MSRAQSIRSEAAACRTSAGAAGARAMKAPGSLFHWERERMSDIITLLLPFIIIGIGILYFISASPIP
ncbi:MAG: hypothetical protein QXS54_06960 [Candidatus Methanomethylicaceae archaeon]